MSEFTIEKQQVKFGEVVDILSKLVKPTTVVLLEEDRDFEYPSFEGNFQGLELKQIVKTTANLGDKVNCEVLGDSDMGIAVIFRPRNPFAKQRYGFFIQPENEGHLFTVWHGPARKPEKDDWIGASLLDRGKTRCATPELANSLVDSLRSRSET